MTKFLGYLIGGTIGALFLAVTIAYTVFSVGYVLSCLWDWHAVPLGYASVRWQLFAVLPAALNLVRSRGIGADFDKLSGDQKRGAILRLLLGPWLVLLVGWLLK